jgi:DNA polymerase I
MEITTHSIYIQEGAFNVLIAPEEIALGIFNEHLELQNYLILYICGNYSALLSRLNRKFTEFDVRRAFTAFQLLKILKEQHHSFIFIEYDPTLFSEHEELLDHIPLLLREISSATTVLLYSPRIDRFLRIISEKAHRVFFVSEFDRQAAKKKVATQIQCTLEEF